MSETEARDDIARLAGSLFEWGLTFGSSGNIGVRLEDGWPMTPTGVSMCEIDPARIGRLDDQGPHTGEDKPTEESVLHLAMYDRRPVRGIVHLHSTHSVAVNCLADVETKNALPPITA